MAVPEVLEYAERQDLSRREIENYLKTDGVVSSIEFRRLLKDTSESCVDGRSREGVIGTPGGNAGEFLLMLTTMENLTKGKFSDDNIRAILREYTEKLGKFYFHTDTRAIDVVSQVVNHNVSKYFRDENLKTSPPEELRERLLNELVLPATIGCGHIKLMMMKANEYGVRPELVQSFILAFYQELWAGNPQLELVVLEGSHQEKAVLTVLLDESVELTDDTRIPTIAPAGAAVERQMFVHHPGVIEHMRKRTVKDVFECVQDHSRVLTDINLEVGGRSYKDYLKIAGDIGARQLQLTVGILAKDLPMHTAIFKVKDDTWEIQVF